MRKVLIVSIVVFMLASCSMPETKIYSLYVPVNSVTPVKKSVASISIVLDSPRYLDQPYIAYRKSPYQFAVSKYSKWDTSPSESVTAALKERLYSTGLFREVRASSVMPAGFYLLKVTLKKFEMYESGGSAFGELSFDTELFSPDGSELSRDTITKGIKLEDKSYLSLAKGLSSALSEGAEEIKAKVVTFISK